MEKSIHNEMTTTGAASENLRVHRRPPPLCPRQISRLRKGLMLIRYFEFSTLTHSEVRYRPTRRLLTRMINARSDFLVFNQNIMFLLSVPLLLLLWLFRLIFIVLLYGSVIVHVCSSGRKWSQRLAGDMCYRWQKQNIMSSMSISWTRGKERAKVFERYNIVEIIIVMIGFLDFCYPDVPITLTIRKHITIAGDTWKNK